MARKRQGFTLVEIIIASGAMAVLLVGICGILGITLKRWDVQSSSDFALQESNVALQSIQRDCEGAVSFTTVMKGANTLYVFTLPANTDAQGNYVPVRSGPNLIYNAGPQVAYYLSNIGGARNTRNGTMLWRATAKAGANVWTPDLAWSRVNNTVARCPNITAFSVSSAGMPSNVVQVKLTLTDTSGHTTQIYARTRQIYLSNHN